MHMRHTAQSSHQLIAVHIERNSRKYASKHVEHYVDSMRCDVCTV